MTPAQQADQLNTMQAGDVLDGTMLGHIQEASDTLHALGSVLEAAKAYRDWQNRGRCFYARCSCRECLFLLGRLDAALKLASGRPNGDDAG